MSFNELNGVEHYSIHQLAGENLNTNEAQEPKIYGAVRYIYLTVWELPKQILRRKWSPFRSALVGVVTNKKLLCWDTSDKFAYDYEIPDLPAGRQVRNYSVFLDCHVTMLRRRSSQ